MSKKLYIIPILIIVGLGIWFVSIGQLSKKQNVGLANQASVFCVDNGGRLDIRTDSTGGQFGVCVFDNNTECEEWMYFRGECKMGEVKNDIPIKEEMTAVLNQKILNGGIYITPLQVVSDSRCSVGVQCIWAGEILIKVKLEKGAESKEVELKEFGWVSFAGSNVSLISVIPENKTEPSILEKDYQFTFKVVPVNKQGTFSGTVTLSPVCPVERIPPDPNCAPKPYSTSINIMKAGSTVVIKTIQSDLKGTFNVDLSPGIYTLQAQGGSVLPRCPLVSVEVKSGQYANTEISCDTGIR